MELKEENERLKQEQLVKKQAEEAERLERERLEQERDEEPYAGPTPTNEPEIIEETQEEDISDWDVTLMDGLEDEELFFHEEPTIKEEEQFDTVVDESIDNEPELLFSDEFLEEAIAEFNRNSFEEELDEMDGEPVYQSETKEVDQINEIVDNVINEDEPIFEKIIDRTNITNQDGLFFSQNVTENVQETSSETNDEKKN